MFQSLLGGAGPSTFPRGILGALAHLDVYLTFGAAIKPKQRGDLKQPNVGIDYGNGTSATSVASNTVSWDRRQQRCFDGIVLGLGDLCAKDQLSLSQSCAMAARLGAQFDSRPSALPVCVVIEVPHKESVSMEGMMDCTAELV